MEKSLNIEKVQSLSLSEQKEIVGGDNLTRSVFRYLGKVAAYIGQGCPHGAYGVYAGM